MNHIGKRIVSLLCAVVMCLSWVTLPDFEAAAAIETVTEIPTENVVANFTADTFTRPYGDPIVLDEEAATGKAVMYSYADRKAAYDLDNTKPKPNPMIRVGEQTLEMYSVVKPESVRVATITVDQLKEVAGQGYVVYKFAGINIMPEAADNSFLYLFDCWGFQCSLNNYKEQLTGKTVDVYLSMKITGDVTNTVDNTPTYYIDQVAIVDPNAPAPEPELPGADLVVPNTIASFTADDFFRAYGDPIVDDPESAQGKAAKYSYADRKAAYELDSTKPKPNPMIRVGEQTLEMYSVVKPESVRVATLTVDQLKEASGKGYVVYKFEDINIMPEPAADSFLYLFDCWGFQCKLNDYKEQLTGKTVDVYLSMKITGDVTNTVDNTPTYYIDKVVIAEPEVQETPEEELRIVFRADDFFRAYGDPIVDDPDSLYGKAAKYSYADRKAAYDLDNTKPSPNPMIRVGEQTLEMYAVVSPESVRVATLTVDQLKEASGQGYVVYKFENIDIMPEPAADSFLYLFDCWGFQCKLNDYKEQLTGKKVDVYLSMKITGDVTNTVDNTPIYYIDEVVIESHKEADDHEHVYGDWTYVDENNHSATCECTDVKTEAHKWDDGVVANGQITYTCSDCGGTKTEEQELTLIFLADDFARPYGDPIVDDSDSVHGKAAKYSYAERKAAFDLDPNKPSPMAMIRVEPQTLDVRTNNNIVVGIWSVTELQAAGDAGYILTKFENVQLTDANFIYIFDCWGFQVPLTAHKDTLADLTVNVYVSMKIVGDVTNTTDNSPTYYIDKVVITTGEYEQEHVHSYENWTYVDENSHSGTCECTDVKTEAHKWDDGVAADGVITYTCSLCGGTKTEAEPGELTLEFYASDFVRPYGDPVVIDGDSNFGTAVKYSYADRKPAYDADPSNKPNPMAMVRVEPQTLDVRTNNNILVGLWSVTELQAAGDAGYVVYEFTNVELTDAAFIYIFDCWGFQVPLTQHKDALKNLPVNVYVSMKITGDVTNTADNTPTYYIDQVVITTGEYVADSEEHSYGDWVYVDENNHSASCSHCDEVLTDAHMWDEGVITLKPTVDAEGERTYTCSLCNGTKVEPVKKVNPEGINLVFYPDQFFLPYGDPVVSDSSAEGGKAAKFSFKDREATGDKGLANAMIFGGEHMLDIRTNNNGMVVGRLPAGTLMNNAEKGKYLTYKFANINLTDSGFIYIFDCWGFQVLLGEYADILKDERVYVYVTLKVTGNVGDRLNDTPTYYISKVEISSKNRTVDSDMKDPINIVIPASEFVMPYSNADAVKSDSQSKYGQAAVFSYEKRLATGDKGLSNAMILGGDRVLELFTFGGDPKEGYSLGSISNERLNYHANKDGYVLYTFRNVKMIPTAGSYIFYMFDCWGMNIALTEAQVQELLGQRVDISVSMKVKGNVMDPNDPPTYYIDYIKIVSTAGAGCVHDYGDWVLLDGENHEKTCFACNEKVTEAHTWDEGVQIEGMEEGHKLFTCSVCNGTSEGTEPGAEVPTEDDHTCTCETYTNENETGHSGICSICGETVIENHTWDNGVVAQEATKEKEGEMLYTCTACGATKSEIIEKLTDKPTDDGKTENPIEDLPFFNSDTILWIVLIGVFDIAAIVFLVILLKKRKK